MTQDEVVALLERKGFRWTNTLSDGSQVMMKKKGFSRLYAEVAEDGSVNGEDVNKFLRESTASGSRVAGDDVSELGYMLEEIEESLMEAMEVVRKAEGAARSIGGEISRVVGGQLDLYLGRTLKSFVENDNQPGSVASLQRFMDRWEQERIEEGREASVKTASGRVGSTSEFTRDLHTKGGEEFKAGERVRLVEYTKEYPYRVRFEADGGRTIKLPIDLAWKIVRGFPKPPSLGVMEKWSSDGVAKAIDGSRTEPDGFSHDGAPSWMLVVGVI